MSFLPRVYVTLAFSVLAVFSAAAQILNVEKSRVEKDSSNYFTGKVGLDFSLFNRANTDEGPGQTDHYLGITGNGNIGYVSDENTYLLLASYNYVRLHGQPEVETGYIHGRVTLRRKKLVSYELYSQVQYDHNRGLEPRALVGAGVRFSVVRTNSLALHLGTGVMYEHERWLNAETNTYITKNLPKLSNYVSIRLPINPYLELNTIHYYQVGYDNGEDVVRHRISGDIAFTIKMTNRLQLSTSFSHTYENRPIVPIPKYLYSLTNGIQVTF